MKHLKIFEEYNRNTLIIVDVQKSFSKFFSKKYIEELNKYCLSFDDVYQIFDNHFETKPDTDFLYDEYPDIENIKDLYSFNNQVDVIEKRYNYNINIDYFKKILDTDIYKNIKTKETNNTLKVGEKFRTIHNTIIVYIGNNHKWYHIGKKMLNLFHSLSGKEVTIVGGSQDECILDIIISAKSMGVNVKENVNYIYSATKCPI